VTRENEQMKGDREVLLPRPDSIAQAMQRALAAPGDFARALAFALNEFLDAFYLDPVVGRLEDEPQRTDAFSDAWVAACAEHLALQHHLPVPLWVQHPCRFALEHPWFGLPAHRESTRATLFVTSPLAFKRRNLFVVRDPLARA
jgi:hypothetical protein